MHLITINSGKKVTEDTLISIEKIKAPILFLSAVNDSIWLSYESSLYMEKYLKEKSFSYPYKHVAYKAISHVMLTETNIVYGLAFKTERKNVSRCKEERIQLKNELLDWIEKVWE